MMQRPTVDPKTSFPATQSTAAKAPVAADLDFSAPSESPAPIQSGQYRGPKADRRMNAYPGKCVRCHTNVPAGAGWLTGSRQAGWGVEHKDGECGGQREAVTPDPTQDRTGAAAAPQAKNWDVPDGRYTVQWQDGSYKTIRVRTRDQFDDFMPGRQVLSYLSGSNNDRDYTQFGHVDEHGFIRIWKKHQGSGILREAVKVLAGDPRAASKAYAQASGECGVCGRTLTTPESIENGIGPECAKRTGW